MSGDKTFKYKILTYCTNLIRLHVFNKSHEVIMSKKFMPFMAVVSIAFLLGACASQGNTQFAKAMDDGRSIDDIIIDGKTTKTQVKAHLGEPSDVDYHANGDEKWTYDHTKRNLKAVNFVPVANWFMRGTNDTKKKLVIIFDKNDVVKKHQSTTAKGETKMGLLG
jgi:outer membrane protein assembly factor BamE (lipoprotein component of BamABCDE complex)